MTTHRHTAGGETRTYIVWRNMLYRCRDPKDPRYLADPRWEQFECFVADMGDVPPRMTLVRIDPTDGGYSRKKCKWGPKWSSERSGMRSSKVSWAKTPKSALKRPPKSAQPIQPRLKGV